MFRAVKAAYALANPEEDEEDHLEDAAADKENIATNVSPPKAAEPVCQLDEVALNGDIEQDAISTAVCDKVVRSLEEAMSNVSM